MFGLYIQFHGDFGPGGGFQAGVVFASGFILYGLVFSLDKLKKTVKPELIYRIAAAGVLVFVATGMFSIITQYNFLDYTPIGLGTDYGQHYGILIIEFGVGMTVFATILAIYYAFAGRSRNLDDKDW